MSTKLTIKTPHLGLFVARRNSGKTHLARHLLHVLAKAQRFRWVEVICPTAFASEWPDIVGEKHCHEEFDEGLLEDLLEGQAEVKRRGDDNPGLIILDDCLGAGPRFNDDLWTRIATAGRHYGVTVWITAQHLFRLPPTVRVNADYVFVLGVQVDRVARDLFENFGGCGYSTWHELRMASIEATRDYGAFVIDNTDPAAPTKRIRAPKVVRRYRIKQ